MPAIGSAAANAAHILDEHQFLMPRPIVVHDRQQGKLVMNCCPQDTGSVIQVTIALDIDDDAIAALCRQRSANRSRSTIAHAACALSAQLAVRLFVIPKLHVVCAGETARRSQAPVFVLDPGPTSGVTAPSRDGSRVRSLALGLL